MKLIQCSNSRRAGSPRSGRRSGYVLYAVLIMIVVLSLVAYRFTDAMTTEYRGAQRTEDMAKLRAAAYSGITYAMANLADPSTFMEMGGSAPYTINPSIFNNQTYYADQLVYQDPKGDSKHDILFSIVSVVPTVPGTYTQQYGVIDEGAKININALAQLDPSGNTLYNVLLQLPNMAQNQSVAANIVAYVLQANAKPLSNNAPTGAPSSYYQTLSNPYYAKNGPLNTLDELLMVDGVTPTLLYGNDQNMNGYGDDLNTGGTSGSSGSNSGYCDRGWQDYLTVNGREFNITSTFFQGSTGSLANLRIDVNSDSDGSGGSLSGIYSALQSSTINQDLVTYIMGAKLFGTQPAGTMTGTASISSTGGITFKINTPPAGTISQLQSAIQTKLQNSSSSSPPKGQSIASLVTSLMNTQVSVPITTGSGKDQKTENVMVKSPLTTQTASQYLPDLLDQATTSSQVDMVPRVNLSTASQQVITALLLGIPGPGGSTTSSSTSSSSGGGLFTQTDVQNVISAQGSLVAGQPATTSGAWLLTQAQLTPSKFQTLSTYATGTSMLYRVQAIGYYRGTESGGSGGSNAPNWPMARVEALIDTNLGYPRIVYMRELTSLDNPRGFILPLSQQN